MALTFAGHRRKANRAGHLGPSLGHVQAHSDRQSRRDRLPDHQDRASHGNWDGRGLFRGRSRCASRRDGGRGRPDRPAGRVRELSGRRKDHRSLQTNRCRSRASRLRLLVRARGLSHGAGEGGDRVHRSQSQGHRRHGRQNRVEEGGRQGRSLDRPRPSRDHRGRKGGATYRRPDRLSDHDQGLGRRRRQGYAHRAQQGRGGGRFCPRALGSEILLRRRPRVHP